MKKLLTLLIALSTFTVNANTIPNLIENLENKTVKEHDFPYDVYELILSKVESSIWPDYSTLTQSEQYVLMVIDFEGQINNGGFDQYYYNSYGDNALETVDALRAIGANETAELLLESFEVFPATTSSQIREERWAQLEALSEPKNEKLSALDDKFYEYPNDLADLLTSYIKSNLRGSK